MTAFSFVRRVLATALGEEKAANDVVDQVQYTKPNSMTDSNAQNGSLYYSSDSSELKYKNSSGTSERVLTPSNCVLAQLSESEAPNNSIFYNTDDEVLSWKDVDGTVQNLTSGTGTGT